MQVQRDSGSGPHRRGGTPRPHQPRTPGAHLLPTARLSCHCAEGPAGAHGNAGPALATPHPLARSSCGLRSCHHFPRSHPICPPSAREHHARCWMPGAGHGRTRQGVRPSRPGPPGPTFLGLPRVLLTPLLGTGPPDSTRVPRAGGSAHGSLQRFHVAQVGAPARGLPGTQPPLWAQPLPSPLTSDPEHAAALPEHPGEARGGGIRGAPAQLGALRFQGPGVGGGGGAARFTSPAANGRLSVGQGAGGAPGCPAGRAEGVSRRL